MTKNSFTKKAITDDNLFQYLKEVYNYSTIANKEMAAVSNIQPQLQTELAPGENNCSVTCMATIISKFVPYESIKEIYSTVEKMAKYYFYKGDTIGMIPIFIKPVMNKLSEYYKLNLSAKSEYLFLSSNIIKSIKNNQPVILSLHKDGRDYYHNHSVIVVGYVKYRINNNKDILMLKIYDNWAKRISYIDWDKLCIASIDYFK